MRGESGIGESTCRKAEYITIPYFNYSETI